MSMNMSDSNIDDRKRLEINIFRVLLVLTLAKYILILDHFRFSKIEIYGHNMEERGGKGI